MHRKNKTEHHILISDKDNVALRAVLNYKLENSCKINSYKNNTCYIFDNNTLNFKDIIAMMANHSNLKNISYNIQPQKACFLIGSNSSRHRGEVIQF